MSAVTLAELSRLRETDIVESSQLVGAITTEIRLGLSGVIKPAQQYIETPFPEGHELLVSDKLFLPRRTRLIGIEPFIGSCGNPSASEVRRFTAHSAALLKVSDDLMLAPRQGQLVISVQDASTDDAPLLVPITTRRLARGLVNLTWATGRDVADANAVLWDLVLMPLEDLRQQIRSELEGVESDEAAA